MNPLRVAVIGIGQMGKHHARIYNSMRSVDLVAVCDLNETLGTEIAKDYHCKYYKDYKEMCKKEKLDAVSVATPIKFHHDVANYLIQRRINILLEKPITENLSQAKKLVNLAQRKKIVFMVGHIERFNPALQELKIRIGKLGKVHRVEMQRMTPFPLRIQDVGVGLDLLVHDVDILEFILNSKIKRVYAEVAKRVHSKKEDLISALLALENGTIANINTDWLTPTKIRGMRICGDKGMFVVNYATQELFFYENPSDETIMEGDMTRIKITQKEPLFSEIEEFLHCVMNKKNPSIGGKEATRALFVALKVLESSKKKKMLKI